MRRPRALLAFFLILPWIAGCGARETRTTPPAAPSAASPGAGSAAAEAPPPAAADDLPTQPEPRVIDLEPIRIEVVGQGHDGPELDAFDARSLLDEGNAALAEERHDDAIARYEKLVAVFPDSRLVPAAMYNIGLALEGKGDHDAAIRQYRTLARTDESSREAIEAQMRMGGVLAELQRWGEAREILQTVLARSDLTHSERIEGMARLGYATLEQKNFAGAEAVLRDAIAYYGKLTTSLDTSYFVAMAHYYLAEIPHRQFQAIPMRLPDEQLKKDLEAKAELVALAYDRYVETLQIQNVYWATAAGYQLSQIYKEFWDDIVLAPIPTQLDSEASKYYVREVHDRVRIFLEKAMSGHSKNLEIAEAYRTSTVWSDASRVRAAEIADILARETSGELVTPHRGASQPALAGTEQAVAREYIPGRIEL